MNSADDTPVAPTQELRAEHRVIERVLHVLNALIARPEFQAEALGECITFFRLFADACHHGKEEDMLFPALERHGLPRETGPIAVMLREHAAGRALVAAMGQHLSAAETGDAAAQARFREIAREYISLLAQHIWKEDNVLFRMGEHQMGPQASEELGGHFCNFRCREFEGRRREELIAIADRLASRWTPSA